MLVLLAQFPCLTSQVFTLRVNRQDSLKNSRSRRLIVKLFLILDLKWRRAISKCCRVCACFWLENSPNLIVKLLPFSGNTFNPIVFYFIRSYRKNPKRRRTRNARRDTRHHHQRVKVIERSTWGIPRKHIRRRFYFFCFLISRWLKIKLINFCTVMKNMFSSYSCSFDIFFPLLFF